MNQTSYPFWKEYQVRFSLRDSKFHLLPPRVHIQYSNVASHCLLSLPRFEVSLKSIVSHDRFQLTALSLPSSPLKANTHEPCKTLHSRRHILLLKIALLDLPTELILMIERLPPPPLPSPLTKPTSLL